MPTFTGTATVTDAAGHVATVPVAIIQTAPPPPLTVAVTVAPTSGPPGTKFTITAVAAGGTTPYTYTISTINGVQPAVVSPGVWTITI